MSAISVLMLAIFRAAIKTISADQCTGVTVKKVLKENFNRAEFKRQINTGIIRLFL